MSVLTQGTKVYFIDPDTGEVMQVVCTTSFSPGGAPAGQIEDTCLEAFERSYKPGLRTPGQASLGLNADPEIDSHVRLHELSETNPPPTLKWAVGWADGTDEPAVDSNGEWDLPDTRTWFLFEGYVSNFPFDFTQNSVVATAMTIQRAGGSQWVRKGAGS